MGAFQARASQCPFAVPVHIVAQVVPLKKTHADHLWWFKHSISCNCTWRITCTLSAAVRCVFVLRISRSCAGKTSPFVRKLLIPWIPPHFVPCKHLQVSK